MARSHSTLVGLTVLVLLSGSTSGVAAAAPAAGLVQITGFGSNPGNLTMYSYRPAGLGSGRPLVVALHGCTQSATDFFQHAGWPKYADVWRFGLVLAEQKTANNIRSCFNWFEPADTTRGQGEALSIKQMVDHAVARLGADPRRVFVTGLSAGGAMTTVMLATYPDVFAGGAVIAGLAYRCAADLVSALTCMNSPPPRTPKEWGDLVRNAYPANPAGYPRITIWHGSADTTVVPANADRLRDQWTDVWKASQQPTSTITLPGGTTRETYGAGVTVFRVPGMRHGAPVDPGSDEDRCGTAGQYYLDTLCSAFHTGVSWGLKPA
jgi:poly(hydroxyalkanoate) depolymerase family esterase